VEPAVACACGGRAACGPAPLNLRSFASSLGHARTSACVAPFMCASHLFLAFVEGYIKSSRVSFLSGGGCFLQGSLARGCAWWR
jgi:hypothetical protein